MHYFHTLPSCATEGINGQQNQDPKWPHMETVHLLTFTMPIQMPIFQIPKEIANAIYSERNKPCITAKALTQKKIHHLLQPDAYVGPL